MPDLPIVDAHLHLRDPDHFRTWWLDATPLLNRRYSLAEYREHVASDHVRGAGDRRRPGDRAPRFVRHRTTPGTTRSQSGWRRSMPGRTR